MIEVSEGRSTNRRGTVQHGVRQQQRDRSSARPATERMDSGTGKIAG